VTLHAPTPEPNWPDRPLPVSLVITDLDVGGAERALVALALGLDRTRWDPSVIALGPEGELVEPLRGGDVKTRCLNVDRRRPMEAVRRLAEALQEQRPVLIQSFLFHANIAARLAAQAAGSPPVVSGLRVAEREKGWHLWLDWLTASRSAGVVCVSNGVRRQALARRAAKPERLVVIPNGIDPTVFDASPVADRLTLGVPLDAQFVLYVGRMERQKGVSDLLRAASDVIASRADVHFVLVGDGPRRAALEWESWAQPPQRDRVHWLGRRSDVPSLLKAADLLVLPSLWEGMPNVVLEAMAARRAVVATAVEGSEDLVEPGKTGWLVPRADPLALSAALLDALSDAARLRRYGELGRSRVESEFAQSAVISAYERFWGEVLGFGDSVVKSGATR
jgi:glycosyltransferase involved in cell wall biosynthesis